MQNVLRNVECVAECRMCGKISSHESVF